MAIITIKKNSLFVLLLLICLIPVTVSADTGVAWTKSIGSVTAADISEYGEYIYAGSNGTLVCYDVSGTVKWQKSLSGQIVKIRTTQSGNYAAIITSSSDKSYLYDSSGALQWEKLLPYTPVDVDISKDGGIISIVAEEQFWNYDTTGNLVGTYPAGAGSWSECAVDPDNQYLLMSNSTNNLYKYKLNHSSGWPDTTATSYVLEGWDYRQLITPGISGNVSLNVSFSEDTLVDIVVPESKTNNFKDIRITNLNYNLINLNLKSYFNETSPWTLATDAPGWTARHTHQALVFDNKMWVLGGYNNANFDDVWYSEDGISWTRATDAPGWTARYAHQALVFDNKMWVLGGFDGGAYFDDVWYSEDGISWTLATDAPVWTARHFSEALVFDNKMWVLGGSNGAYLDDVWYSEELLSYSLDFVSQPSYLFYGNPDAAPVVRSEILSPSYYAGSIGSEEEVNMSIITQYQTSKSHLGTISAIDLPESGDWVGVSTASNIYHDQITDTGFGTSYTETSTGTVYDIATADSGAMSIEGRGIIADIYQIDATKVGTYTTGGTVSHTAIADKNALWAASGGTDGKVYVFSKDESSSWYLDYASDSYEPITALAVSWRGEYIVAGRGSGLTLYQTGEDTSSDTTLWFNLYVFKDQKKYTYAPVNVSVYQNEVWDALEEGTTDSDGKYVIELRAGTKYKFNVNDEKIVILDASSALTSRTINILTSPISTALDYSAVYNSTSNKIEMSYEDTTDTTDSVTFTVYRTDTWEQVYSHTTTDSSDVDDSYSVVDDTVDYKVELNADRDSKSIVNHFFVSTGDFIIPLPLDNNIKNAIFSCFLIFLSGLFGYASSARGALVVAFVAGGLVYFGWLTIPVFWVVVAIVIALLAGFSQRRY